MTKRSKSDICRGSGRVRLPKCGAPSVTAFDPNEPPSVADCSWREYACPECSEMAPVERVQVLRGESEVNAEVSDPRYVEAVTRSAAHRLVDDLLRRGFIRVERSDPKDDYRGHFAVRASMGAVSLKKLDTIEERIAVRQTEIAQEVTAEAVRQVDNWNSHHGDNAIRRSDAKYLIGESIRTVIKRRLAKWRPMESGK